MAVKEAVFPFARFPGVDTLLGPEMRSTGEVMGLDESFDIAFAKSQIGGGTRLPRSGTVFVSVKDADKARILPAVQAAGLAWLQGHRTSGTQRFLGTGGRRRQDQQGAGGPAPCGGRHQKRRGSACFQHHRGGRGPGGQPIAAPRGPLA